LDDSPFQRAKFPFKLLQYLALGVPAVAGRVGTAAELIQHEENGLLASTPGEWGDAVERLIRDLELRRRLARAGRQTVAAQFTIERVGPLFIQAVYR
jgi:glycosyltransferase involved in cell wall biosynthesis